MYEEIYTPDFRYFWQLLGLIAAALAAFCFPEIAGIKEYVWIYEIAVVAVCCALLYVLMRKRFYVYRYIISEDVVQVKLSVSSKTKEQTLCAFETSTIERVFDLSECDTKTVKKELGIKLEYKCTGKSINKKGTGIVFRDPQTGEKSLLVFAPGKKFLQFLSEKSVDKA